MHHVTDVRVPDRVVLSDDEVRRLIREAQSGDEAARNRLVEANLRLVLSIVQRYKGRSIDLDDLFQVGCVGLIHAIMKFDLSYPVQFSTYAVPRIIGEIRQHLRADRPFKVGRTLGALGAQVGAARERLTADLERSPTPEEIAKHLGVSREDVLMALEADLQPASLDQPVDLGDGDPIFLKDQLPVEEGMPVENLALSQILQSLSEEERLLVTLRYLKQMPQTQVAEAIRCSQANVSRMERRVIDRMRRLWNA